MEQTQKKTDIVIRPLSGNIEAAHLGSMLKGRTKGADGKIDYGQNVIVVVPESVTLAYEQVIMREIRKEGFLTVTVMSPKILQQNVFEYAGIGVTGKGDKISRITKEGTTLRLYEEMSNLSEKDQLSFFKKPFRPVAVKRIYDCIDVLKAHGYTPDILDQMVALPDITPLRQSKFSDIAAIWHLYENHTSITEFDDQRFWKQMCARVPYCDFLQGAHIMFYGFAFVYAYLLDLIIACNNVANSIDFCIQAPPDNNGCFSGANESISTAVSVLNKLEIPCKVEAVCRSNYGQYADAGISYLADRIINNSVGTKKEPDLAHVEVYQASSQYNEVLYAVQKLIDWHEAGFDWNKLAISCPDDPAINAILPQVLKTANIPFCFRNIRPLSMCGCAYFLEYSIKCICDNYEQEDVFSLLKSGYTSLSQDEAMQLQNYAMEHGITNKKWLIPFRYVKNTPQDITDEANALRERVVEPLEKLHKALFGSVGVKAVDQMKLLFDYLIECNAYEKLKEENRKYIEAGLKDEADFVRQSWDYIKNCLDTVATQAFKTSHLSMQAMSAFIPMILNESAVKFIPQYANAVYVDTAGMLIPTKFACTVILGDQDKVITPKTDILSSDDKKWLQRHDQMLKDKRVLPFFDTVDDMDPSIVYQNYFKGLISATNQVCITSSMVSYDGTEIQPGALFNMAFNMLKDKHPRNIHGGTMDAEIRPFCREVAIELLSAKLRQYHEFGTGELDPARKDPSSQTWQKMLYYFQNNSNPDFEAVCGALNKTVHVDDLKPQVAQDLFSDEITSVSELEDYASCPYRHFLKYGLHVKSMQEYSFEANLQGIFTHAALDLYMEDAMKDPQFPGFTHEKTVQTFNNAIKPLLDDLFSGPLSESVLDKMHANELIQKARTVAEIITHWFTKTEFRPVSCEVVFSNEPGSTIPALNIKLDNGKVISLKGKIDRVDQFVDASGGIFQRCVDYKSSAQDLERDAVERGFQLQLMTYLLALKEANPGMKPAGALYQHVKEPVVESETLNQDEIWDQMLKDVRLNGVVLDDKEVIEANGESVAISKRSAKNLNLLDEQAMHETLDGVKDSIKRHVRNIYDGGIQVRPVKVGHKHPCAFCDYKTVCGFDPSIPGCCVRDIYGNELPANDFTDNN